VDDGFFFFRVVVIHSRSEGKELLKSFFFVLGRGLQRVNMNETEERERGPFIYCFPQLSVHKYSNRARTHGVNKWGEEGHMEVRIACLAMDR
jgi:hypothetical protein